MRNTVPSTNAPDECSFINVSQAENEIEAFKSRVVITVTHFRHRKCDFDAPCIKWALDGIVKAGILKDDSTDEIKEIRHQFERCKSKDEERTVFEIETCEGD